MVFRTTGKNPERTSSGPARYIINDMSLPVEISIGFMPLPDLITIPCHADCFPRYTNKRMSDMTENAAQK